MILNLPKSSTWHQQSTWNGFDTIHFHLDEIRNHDLRDRAKFANH